MDTLKGTALSNMACGFIRFPDLALQVRGTQVRARSAEHAYQAIKTLDPQERERILLIQSPYDAKKAGRDLVLREDWEAVQRDVMREILVRKFQHPYYRQALVNTGQEEIVEGNTWHDNRWGRCTCPRCRSRGLNWLGQLLMEIRG